MSNGTSSVTIIVGNLGADPELRFMPNGDAVLNLSVATSESWKNDRDEKQTETEWHRCVLFRRRAENAAKFLKKGSKVWIQGRNRTRKWTGEDKIDRYTTEIMVRDIQYLDRAPEHSDVTAKVGHASDIASQIPDNHEIPFDDDIPF